MSHPLVAAFEQHREALLGFIRNRLGDDALAEDVLQETYLRAQRQDDSHAVQYPKAYLYRIANNLIIDAQRKQQRQSEVPLERASEEIDPRSPERHTLVEEQLKQVTLAINELPEKTREVFRLQRLQDTDKRDVASQLGISVNMVEKHLRRAVQHCRNRLFKQEK